MIAQKFKEKTGLQDYGSKKIIDGVELVESRLFSDDGGNFAEILRYDEGKVKNFKEEFLIKQMSWSYVLPKAVKAYHYHLEQEDLWFVPPFDRLVVNLHDLRKDSPTFDQHMKLTLGAGKNLLLRIPIGVAHGCSNPYNRPMTLIYATSAQFDPKNPDEHRIEWNSFGSEIWEIDKG
jgi:dTDP-4-dehydrorhamnose 3,5-epimerase